MDYNSRNIDTYWIDKRCYIMPPNISFDDPIKTITSKYVDDVDDGEQQFEDGDDQPNCGKIKWCNK
jgi:hypothetical protein